MTNLELDSILERSDYPQCLFEYSVEVLAQLVQRLKDRLGVANEQKGNIRMFQEGMSPKEKNRF